MSEWRRVYEVAEPIDALAAVEAGADWIFFWCAGNPTPAGAPKAQTQYAISHARANAIGAAEVQRLAAKAERKGRTKTVVFAEMWVRSDGQRMVVFCEGAPAPWANRPRPDHRARDSYS